MTKLQRHALAKIIKDSEGPIGKGNSYDGSLKLVEKGDGPEVLDSEMYKLGWKRCWEHFKMLLEFSLKASAADLRKYAGKPK